jgi:hypothetical protein
MAGGGGSSISAPVRCFRAPRASRLRRGQGGRAGPHPITGVHGVAFSPYGKLLGIAGPRCPLPAPWPWDVTAGPAGCGSARRDVGRTSLPGASALCPGVTVSDAGGQGERTRTRRYGRQADLVLDFIHGDRTRRSARGPHSRLVCDTADDRMFASGPAVTAPVDGDVVLRWPDWPAASLSMPPVIAYISSCSSWSAAAARLSSRCAGVAVPDEQCDGRDGCNQELQMPVFAVSRA